MNVIRKSEESVLGYKFIALEPITAGEIVRYCNLRLGIAERDIIPEEILNYRTGDKTNHINAIDFCPYISPVRNSFSEYLERSIETEQIVR